MERPGRKPTASTLANVRAVGAILDEDRHATVRQIATEVNISTGSIHKLLHNDMNLSKKAPKFVPRILTKDQKKQRVTVYRENLKSCEDPLFLWSIIMGDESWFSILELEQKQQSLQWVSKDDLQPKKALRSRQAKKTMMEVFFDDQGIIHLEFLPPRMTVTAQVYCGILSQLCEAIQRKHPVLWKENSYCLLHDNVPGHKANKTVTRMMETDIHIVNHPPYSPDLAPADFWFFPLLKSKIWGKILGSVAELQDALMIKIQYIPSHLFSECVHKTLPDRWRKCIAMKGEYFEGDHIIPGPDSELLESSSDSEED